MHGAPSTRRTEAADTADLEARADDSGRLALRLGQDDIEELRAASTRVGPQRERELNSRIATVSGRRTSCAVGTGAICLLIMPDMVAA